MIAKFMLTIAIVGGVGYWLMYSLLPGGPMSSIEPITVSGEPEQSPPSSNYEPPVRDFFVEHRMERERERSERVELLREIVNNPNSSAETRSRAQMEIIDLAALKEKEMLVERLIVAKDFDDAVVFFGEQVVEVIVKSESLTQAQALIVADVVCSGAGVDLRNVRVRFRK
jgi:stage III sporulation protein AH